MKTISLPTSPRPAIVDDADYELVAPYVWSLANQRKGGYVRTTWGGGRMMFMHRLILGLAEASRTIFVDHLNGDGLDNRRANLVVCDNSRNQLNRKKFPTNTSGYRGVTWHRQISRWQAGVKVKGKSHHLGLFDDPKDAGEAVKRFLAMVYPEAHAGAA